MSHILGMRLVVTLAAEGEGQPAKAPAAADNMETAEQSARLVTAMAAFAYALGKDLSEADWSRILDAVLLVAVASQPVPGQAL